MERTGGLRVIAHLDLDCFYAQVEQRRLNISADIPLVVCQWNGIIAVNYAARRYGIQRGFSLSEAKRRCPHVYLAHVGLIHVEPNENPSQVFPDQAKHKASLTRYREASQEVLRVIHKFHDKHHERASIDEVYIELTSSVCQLLHNIFISLQPLKNIHPFSAIFDKLEAESMHQNSLHEQPSLCLLSFHQRLIESGPFSFQYTEVENILHLLRLLYRQSCTPCQQTQLDVKGDNVLQEVCRNIFDESLGLLREISKTSLRLKKVLNVVDPIKNTTEPVEFTTLSVQDFLMALGSVIVYRTREALKDTTGFTVSIGIARTKFFAKWLSSKYKPDTQTILLNSDIEKLLDKIPLLEANGLRGKTGKLLALLLPNVQYLSDISRHYTLRALQDKLSPHGFDSEFAHRLYTLSTGEMEDPVRFVTQVKSMMSCKTFKPVKRFEDMTIYVRLISKDLSERLDAEYRLTGRTPKNFVIHQSGGVSTASRTRSISFFCNVKDQQGTEKMLIEKMTFVLSSRFTSEELLPCSRLGLCAHLHKTKVFPTYNIFERLQATKNSTIPQNMSDFDSIVKRQFNPPHTLQPMKPKVLSRWCKKKKPFSSLRTCSRCKHPEIRISS